MPCCGLFFLQQCCDLQTDSASQEIQYVTKKYLLSWVVKNDGALQPLLRTGV